MPAAVVRVRAGRTQYLGTLKSFSFTGSGLSALEKRRTVWPAASTMSSVTAPGAGRLQPVVDHRPVGRILSGRFFRRQWRVGVVIAADAIRQLRSK